MNQWRHQGARWQYRIFRPQTKPLLSWSLHFSKTLRRFVCMLKVEKHRLEHTCQPQVHTGVTCCCCCCCRVAAVVPDSVRPQRRQPTRLPHPWDSPGRNTGVGCHCLLQCKKVKSESEVAQSCLTLSDPMDCSPPGSSVHGIFQARVLEWGAIAFSAGITWRAVKKDLIS